MTKKLQRKLTIEIIYDNKEDALEVLRRINTKTLNSLSVLNFKYNRTYLKAESTYLKPFVEPRIETIGENKCLIFPSSMNF